MLDYYISKKKKIDEFFFIIIIFNLKLSEWVEEFLQNCEIHVQFSKFINQKWFWAHHQSKELRATIITGTEFPSFSQRSTLQYGCLGHSSMSRCWFQKPVLLQDIILQ